LLIDCHPSFISALVALSRSHRRSSLDSSFVFGFVFDLSAVPERLEIPMKVQPQQLHENQMENVTTLP
jgi:hypothetical protein